MSYRYGESRYQSRSGPPCRSSLIRPPIASRTRGRSGIYKLSLPRERAHSPLQYHANALGNATETYHFQARGVRVQRQSKRFGGGMKVQITAPVDNGVKQIFCTRSCSVFEDPRCQSTLAMERTINLQVTGLLGCLLLIEGQNSAICRRRSMERFQDAAQSGGTMDRIRRQLGCIVPNQQMTNALSHGYDAWFLARRGEHVCNIATERQSRKTSL